MTDQTHHSSLLSSLLIGAVAAFAGYAGAFAIVLQGLQAVGANPAQSASGLFALTLAQGLASLWISWKTRQPINIVWSTPGAAFLIGMAAPEGGFATAVSAFIGVGLLTLAAGLFRPMAQAVASIPLTLSSAMLAGVLLNICLAPAQAMSATPLSTGLVVLVWLLAWRFTPRYATPLAVAVTIVLIFFQPGAPINLAKLSWTPDWTMPDFSHPLTTLSIALPLFIIAMASQNVPGLAVLRNNSYEISFPLALKTSGLGTLAIACFGGHGLNLSAITAALCAGPEAGPNPALRYRAAMAAGICNIFLAALAGLAVAFVNASPPVLIQAVAGLALLSSFASALAHAFGGEKHRLSAAIALLTTISGVSFFGIGGAFWGLMAGGFVYLLERR